MQNNIIQKDMSSLEYVLQPRDYIVMCQVEDTHTLSEYVLMYNTLNIKMCLQCTILSDSKPTGTLMNFSTQLWLKH